MRVAVLSGKGGTGKTTVSTNMAVSLKAIYIDADVEEPNGFLFLKPKDIKSRDVAIEYPLIDDDKCTMCGKCVESCEFNALVKIRDDIMLFSKLCHGCGACYYACNYNAISYGKRNIGIVEEGMADNGIVCKRGLLNVGEPMAVPVIHELLKDVKKDKNIIIDCPPGTSCNVVSALKSADSAILVTEPTAFGLHDLDVAINVVKKFNIPFGVIINKDDKDIDMIDEYCTKNEIDIIGRIPYSRDIAAMYSKGLILNDEKKYSALFEEICERAEVVLGWN